MDPGRRGEGLPPAAPYGFVQFPPSGMVVGQGPTTDRQGQRAYGPVFFSPVPQQQQALVQVAGEQQPGPGRDDGWVHLIEGPAAMTCT